MSRPTKMTKEVLSKFKEAFMLGLSDEEACSYAGVKSPQTLYNYEKKHPDFAEEKVILKTNLRMKAKLALAKMIDPDSGESPGFAVLQWYLSHKAKNEFGGGGEADNVPANNNINVNIKVI